MAQHALSERDVQRLSSGPEASALQGAEKAVARAEQRLAQAKERRARAKGEFDQVVADVLELKAGTRDITGVTVVKDEDGRLRTSPLLNSSDCGMA